MRENSRILQVALPKPVNKFFDYLAPQDVDLNCLIPGVRILVPFQSKQLVGILMAVKDQSTLPFNKLKQAIACLDVEPIFPKDVRELCAWAAQYYHYALGEVFASALPTLLKKPKALPKIASTIETYPQESWANLNDAQAQAVEVILKNKNQFQTFLLDGVTGSGKTEVYLHLIKAILADQKQALVLVPEISLTPQMISRFRARLSVNIAVWHSDLTDKEKLTTWLACKNNQAQIVIGTRSAIFAPFANLGLIVVDEEHDASFKQQDRFRYHARDLAIMRAKLLNIPIVLGSATPSLESLANVNRKQFHYLSLPNRAGGAALPSYFIVDIKNEKLESGLSKTLITQIENHLRNNNQVLLFLNRRGFAPVLYCAACHAIINCSRCSARMVYHAHPEKLRCHYCDAKRDVPKTCDACGSHELQPLGLGTQRLEQTLKKYFPDVAIIRVDRDSTKKKNALEDLLTQINQTPKAILLGTQMLAKGHHFANVTLVGIIDADSGLMSADFRAAEQLGQLLLQVAGRAGREDKHGTVILQTRNPNHALLRALIENGYQYFANQLLAERQISTLPPYAFLALLKAESYVVEKAENFLQAVKTQFNEFKKVELHGPVSALLSKRKGLHCQHLIIKARTRRELQLFLQQLSAKLDDFTEKQGVKWVLDIDPVEVM